MRNTLRRVLLTYGMTGLIIYLALHMIVLFAFAAAIYLGWRPSTITGHAGTWAAAYVLTKLTIPLRLALTAIMTPMVARRYELRDWGKGIGSGM